MLGAIDVGANDAYSGPGPSVEERAALISPAGELAAAYRRGP